MSGYKLPVENYIDEDGLWSERFGPYTAEQMKEAFEAGKAAEREEIAQMFDAEHEKRVDNFAQCAAVAIRARK